ncbi:TIGR00341 family protein [Hydrogenimonas sp.]
MHFPAFFLHDHELDEKLVESLSSKIESLLSIRLQSHVFKKPMRKYPSDSVLFVMISDDDFRTWLEVIRNTKVTIVVLPYEGNPLQRKHFAVPKTIEETIALFTAENPRKISTFIRCNGEPTIQCIMAGEPEWIERPCLTKTLKTLFSMRLRSVQIETAKGQEIKTAALMIEAGHEALLDRNRSYFFKASDNQCRRVSAVIYAPQSILGALKLRLLLAHRKREEAENLPPGIGTVKAESLRVMAPDSQPLSVICNGKKSETDTLFIESVPMKAAIVTGEEKCVPAEDKESVRIQNIPVDTDLVAFFSKKTLPLVPIAAEEAFAELFKKLRDSAVMKRAYLVLLLVSVLMATTGLFQNSSPTIIGAMILAPLMAPIIAFSMGAIRFDETLMRQSLRTILLSILIALAASALFAWWMPFNHVTEQMAMRTHPTLLDLAVAIFAGIAAAYGYANSKVGESLAGVAIAVALVPPLCVSGIGLGWGSWHIFSNAFLLFLANIVGIVVASGAMFYLMGYASRRYASTAFFIKLLMVAIIAVPLWLSTRTLVAEERIYTEFSRITTIRFDDRSAKVRLMRVVKDAEGLHAVVTVTVHDSITPEEKRLIARQIKSRLGEEVRLIFDFREIY